MKKTLSQYCQGDIVTITRLNGSGRLKNRLMELGFRRGETISIIRYAPLKDPVEILVAGCNVSLRVEEADMIEVEPAKDQYIHAAEGECAGSL